MTVKATLSKLNNIIEQLYHQACELDKINKDNGHTGRYTEKYLFSPPLFSQQSENYEPYVLEAKRNAQQIAHLLSDPHHADFVLVQLTSLEQQISALSNAFRSRQSQQNIEKQFKKARNNRFFQKAAKNVMQSSHQLYQQLAETHEFERRLIEMLDLKQRELDLAIGINEEPIKQAVLVLHQRLGRCRQAISKLERQIEMAEKR